MSSVIQSANVSDSLAYYTRKTLGAFGIANRRLGRYQTAKKYLEQALEDMKPSYARVNISGELGVVYRHMDLLEEAKSASELEYETASKLGSERGICRALGTLGMINYQLSQRSHDENLLRLAIKQLTKRVESARRITASMNLDGTDPRMRAKKAKESIKREFIGLSRLSLCYTAPGNLPEAREKSVRVTQAHL